MKLTKEDKQLIGKAREIPKRKKVPGGIIREVGCALLTKNDDVFKGVSLHLYCGIGFCAEHSAIANMVSHSDNTEIKTIVALWVDGKKWGIMYPCGRCRELMQQIDEKNRENTWIIVSEKEKVKLKYLLPGEWI